MNDADLLALCVLEEAGNQPPEGRAGSVRVIMNRMARHFQSDGTLAGTILRKSQFSWVNWASVGGHYKQVATTPAEVSARVEHLFADAKAHQPNTFAVCAEIGRHVLDGTYPGGPAYNKLTDDTVNYLNPDPRIVPHMPAWATPDKLVCIIGAHHFYRA